MPDSASGLTAMCFTGNELYIAELLQRGVKVLIYAGDLDFIANWLGNMRWTLDMEWPGKEAFRETELREWEVNGNPAGKTRSHGGLTFATVHGAGHLVSVYSFPSFVILFTQPLQGAV